MLPSLTPPTTVGSAKTVATVNQTRPLLATPRKKAVWPSKTIVLVRNKYITQMDIPP